MQVPLNRPSAAATTLRVFLTEDEYEIVGTEEATAAANALMPFGVYLWDVVK